MIDLACPNCGRAGSIPREKVNTRLVCKKCLVVFHMNTAGRTMLGEPASADGHGKTTPHSHARSTRERSEGFSGFKDGFPGGQKAMLIGLGVVLVIGGLAFLLARPPQSLVETATAAAEHFASDDLSYIKSLSTSDTMDFTVRWFDAVHPELVKAREEWHSPGTRVQVMVIDENPGSGKGETRAYIYPKDVSTHATNVSSAAATTTGGAGNQPLELKMIWVLKGKRWLIDGQGTMLMKNRPM